MDLHNRLIEAIKHRRIVEFSAHGHHRVVEPHVFGRRALALDLLSYQVGGTSKSGGIPEWRRFHVRDITEFRVTERMFPGRRITSGPHSSFDEIYAIVPRAA